MKIFIENHSDLTLTEVRTAIKAINIQIKRDFAPLWDTTATLVFRTTGSTPDTALDAVLYLYKEADVAGALGYHDKNNAGVPFGAVFTDLSKQLGESWIVTLSHEALELIEDSLANITAMGPHPTANRNVFHWYEVADAVQAQTYKINGLDVSNFVTPLYFTPNEETGKPTNFLNTPLPSFGVAAGSYIGFYDPTTGNDETYMPRGDKAAKLRWKIKQKAGIFRRAARHKFVIENQA